MQYSTIVQRAHTTIRKEGGKNPFFIFLRKVALRLARFSRDFYLPYYLAKHVRGYAIERINGFKMYLDLKNDTGISKDLFLFRKREHLSTDFLRTQHIFQEGDTVLDIGANIGYYVLLESGLVGPTGTVYAIEPVSDNFTALKRNVELNTLQNVKMFRLAAGSEHTKATIHVASAGNLSSFVRRGSTAYTKEEEVEIVKVDDFVAEHRITPRLVRMDIEGYESEVIEGMQETLRSAKPKLLIEIHPFIMKAQKVDRMLSVIEACGYEKATMISERHLQRMKKNGKDSPLFRYLARRIEGRETPLEIGEVREATLEELREYLEDGLRRGRLASGGTCVHALIS